MKKLSNIFAVAILTFAFASLISCNQECDCEKQKIGVADAATRAVELEDNMSFTERLALSVEDDVKTLENISTFKLDPSIMESFSSEEIELLVADFKNPELNEVAANAEAAELVSSIFNSLMAAENTQAQLDVQFLMSEEKVQDGMFLFSIRTQENQDLVFTMYDEEGFGVVANNGFAIDEGDNYKALNVSNIESGTYIFKLKNEKTNKELIRRVEITNE